MQMATVSLVCRRAPAPIRSLVLSRLHGFARQRAAVQTAMQDLGPPRAATPSKKCEDSSTLVGTVSFVLRAFFKIAFTLHGVFFFFF